MHPTSDRWPLTGRDEELRVIGDALVDNEHQGMALTGVAGVGKTRLARAAADAATRDGWAVRRVAGTATGRPVTLGAFARWADDTDSSPLALARSVFEGLTADSDGAPLLVFVDDAHLLDDMSALVVHQLALQNMARIIATIRTGASATDAVTALWKDGLLRRLELQPLSRDESDALLATVLDGSVSTDCAKRMWDLTRGNVLFLRHLVEGERGTGRLARADGEWRWTGSPLASPSLVELVELQIGGVPDDLRDIVDIVAIGEPIERELLTALVDAESIEAAEHRGLVTAPTADTVCVGHPLYGEIRLSQCGPLRLRRLRGRVASAMAETGTGDPLRLGLLLMDSDLAPDAEILSRAAKIAAARLDFASAERLARAAVAADASAEIKLALARILLLHDKGEAAQEILDTIDAEEAAAPGFYDEAILRTATLLWPLANPGEARTVIEDAIALAGNSMRGHALRTMRAVVHVNAAEPADVVATMSTVDYHHLDDFGRVAGYTAETLALGELGLVTRASEKATAAYLVLDQCPEEDAFHGTGLGEFHVCALVAAGFVDEALAVAKREYHRRAEHPGQSRWMTIASLGIAALGKGDLLAARQYLNSASQGIGEQDDISGLLYRFRIPYTEALARSGHIDAAVTSMEITRGIHHPSYQFVEPPYLLAGAWVAAVSGRVADARETSCRAAEFARAHGQLAREVLCLQTGAQFGDVSGADRLADLADQVEGVRAPSAARYVRALAENNGLGLDTVSQEFEAMGDVLAAADAAAQAAASHRLAGRKGSALTSSARAHRLANKCGGAVSPAIDAARVPLPFTRREHEIAKLVSDGLTNKQIAEATSLSVRTVEGHIYQASAKAGVTSRSELSAVVKQFGGLAGQPG